MQTPCVQQSRVQACSDHLGRSGHRLLRSTTAATRCSSRPFASTTRCQARQRSTAAVQQAKQQLASLAGNKYGHNLTAQQKQDIEKVVKQLEDMAPRNKKQPDLTGSDWKLLYTTSSGSSGGKVGLLVGIVDQVCQHVS